MRPGAAGLALAAGLLASGCSGPERAPTDSQIIEDLQAHRGDFDRVVDAMAASPLIWRVERRRDGGWLIRPEDADRARVDVIRDFMRERRISSVARDAEGEVWFVVYEGRPEGRAYQSKTLIHSPSAMPRPMVADSDAALSGPLQGPRIVFRSIDGEWMIRNSAEQASRPAAPSAPARPRP